MSLGDNLIFILSQGVPARRCFSEFWAGIRICMCLRNHISCSTRSTPFARMVPGPKNDGSFADYSKI